MADLNLAKAQLWEMDDEFQQKKSPGKEVIVQFNPESLKVSFANQIQPSTAGDQKSSEGIQFVGAGTTKLSLQLWFDVTQPKPAGKENVEDVRELTQDVAYFITPKKDENEKYKPPATRFLWGTFQFDGVVDSLEESLEFFSPEGRPLRASITLNLTQQKIAFAFQKLPPGDSSRPATGTKPLTQAPAGATVQGLADSRGKGDQWQSIAAANGIENPRMLQPGQLLDMNRS